MKKLVLSKFNLLAMALVILGVSVACSVEDDEVEFTEPVKDISGNWEVVQAFRNEEDITALMDFSQFRINFNGDGTYSFENYLPFLVQGEGFYALDDPQYPQFISLVPENTGAEVKTGLNMPITNGKRQLGLTFSPGCSSNTYTYLFERVE